MRYEEFLEEWRNDSDVILVKTSGSTGCPKEIRLTKDFVKASAQRTIEFFNLNSESRLHSCVSPDFIGGKMMAVRVELSGAVLTWETPTNESLKTLGKEDLIDLLAVVPSQMNYILENLSQLPEIRNIIVGGAPVGPFLREKIVQSGLNVFETFGMTETASHIALRRISADNEPFKVLPGIRISVDKERYNCLKILFDSGETVNTNDVVDLISENEFFVLGRFDGYINSGGKKINPVKVEEILGRGINREICVTSEPDEKWGEKCVVLVESGKSTNKEMAEKIRMKLTGEFIKLEKWERPKALYFVENLPRTDNGKIKRPKDFSSLVFVVPGIDLSSSGQRKQEL